MAKIKIVVLLNIFVLNFSLISQVTQEWVRRYDGPVMDVVPNTKCPLMDLDGSGNIYIAGSIDSDPGPGQNTDFVLIKYNSQGVQQWVQIYDGPGHQNDIFSDLKVDRYGNAFVTGASFIDNDTLYNFCTIKYNTQGIRQWVNSFDSPSHSDDIPVALDVDLSGTVCVAGKSFGNPWDEAAVIKINQNGQLVWSKITDFNAPGGTAAVDVTFDNGGNIIAVIQYCPFEITFWDAYKLNANGDSLWCVGVDAEWRGGGVLGIRSDLSGNLYMAGNATPYFPNLFVGYVKKIDNAGNMVWACSYTDIGYSREIKDFCIDNLGSIFVTGCFSQSGNRYLTSRFSNGAMIWSKVCTNNNSSGTSIGLDNLGNVYVTGSSYTLNTNSDYYTIKYNGQGDSIWAIRYNHSANNADNSTVVKIDTAGHVYVTGFSRNSDGSNSYATVKYDQLTGIKPISSEMPKSFSLSQNYPNPFNPKSNIKFQIAKSGFVRLVVFDVVGREIAALVNEQLQPGTYEVKWDGSNYPSGVYFYKLIAGEYYETRKMVLIK